VIRLVLLVAVIATGLPSQQARSQGDWQTLNHVCGKVVENRSSDPNSNDNLKNVSGAVIQLYRRESGVCCNDSSRIAETKARRSGEFEIKNALPGEYWLVVESRNRKYIMAISHKTSKNDYGSCSDHLFVIRQPETFYLLRMINVD
jgi:hypothetical protein